MTPSGTNPIIPLLPVTSIDITGYKALKNVNLTVRSLTLLAGANSSGKSSILQPLLLLKQTLDERFQTAGALLLNGPHVQLTDATQLLSKVEGARPDGFLIRIKAYNKEYSRAEYIELSYKEQGLRFALEYQEANRGEGICRLTPDMSASEIRTQLASEDLEFIEFFSSKNAFSRVVNKVKNDSSLESDSFNENDLNYRVANDNDEFLSIAVSYKGVDVIGFPFGYDIQRWLVNIIHIPGLRGNPKRTYPATELQNRVRGTFDVYSAGVIKQWQEEEDTASLQALNNSLIRLGLTRSINAKNVNANEVELRVGRLPVGTNKKDDSVNIADVGFGVSQVLPILVALIVAREHQLVYIEQPELHLHPRAQVEMAKLLVEAAQRGVQVIVETHSSLLLLTFQTLIAQKQIAPDKVALQWFSRDEEGATQIALADIDAAGSFGEWPEDFGETELKAQGAYLDAAMEAEAIHLE